MPISLPRHQGRLQQAGAARAAQERHVQAGHRAGRPGRPDRVVQQHVVGVDVQMVRRGRAAAEDELRHGQLAGYVHVSALRRRPSGPRPPRRGAVHLRALSDAARRCTGSSASRRAWTPAGRQAAQVPLGRPAGRDRRGRPTWATQRVRFCAGAGAVRRQRTRGRARCTTRSAPAHLVHVLRGAHRVSGASSLGAAPRRRSERQAGRARGGC